MSTPPRSGRFAALLAVAAIGGCGGGESTGADADSGAEGVGEPIGGSVAALAQCIDWNKGSEAQRQATIDDIRSSLSPQTSERSATSLPDERAYELFESACKERYARSLELYKVYARANAFAPLTEDPPEE